MSRQWCRQGECERRELIDKLDRMRKALKAARHLCAANAGEDKWTEEVLAKIDDAIKAGVLVS